MDAAELKAEIRRRALDLGFDAIGFCSADEIDGTAARLTEFLALGRHGEMDWLARDPERRASPRGLWPDARSVIMLASNYGPAMSPLDHLGQRENGLVSVYAQGRDYHDVLKKRLKALGRWLHAETGQELKVFVDTAPVMEKPLAAEAGLGWQGKHTNLVSRDFGSWLFLSAIYLAGDLPPDAPEPDHCGSCRRCLDICPTAAFPAPYQLDARRCISYLTIEHKGQIPVEFRAAIGNRIYGCDDCLAVCPWNRFAQEAREIAFAPRAETLLPSLARLALLNDVSFRALYSGSPIKRIGRDRFIRNVLIAIGNSGQPGFADVVVPLLRDTSPLVRAMAIWALHRLDASQLEAWRSLQETESESDVLAEWEDAFTA